MRFRNTDHRETLAAEYVLGTLRGAARRRFQRALEFDASLREEVAFWEQRLARFADSVPSVPPPAAAWLDLRRELARDQAARTVVGERVQRHLQRRSRLRRVYAGAAAAASIAAAFLIGQTIPNWPGSSRDTGVPIYVTVLEAPSRDVQWLVSLSPDRQNFSVESSNGYARTGPHDIELWCLSPGRDPIPLGVLPNRPGAVVAFRVPRGLAGEDVRFAITLEQRGGSPTGKPTGPVLTEAADIGAI